MKSIIPKEGNINIQKRGQFKSYIQELAELPSLSDENTKKYLDLFENLYRNEFRHFYSDILVVLFELDKGKSDRTTLVLEQLPANLQQLYLNAIKQKKECSKQLVKLYDHCVMDCSRMKYWKEQDETYQNFTNNTNVEVKEAMEILEEIKTVFTEDIQTIKKERNEIENKISKATNEATNVKKDLVSIMGIFMGVFSFIQWNFSQYKDLLEYDPFNRVIYIAVIDSLLIISLYFVFMIIDFIVHKNPRMAKPFFNTEKKILTKFAWYSFVIYLIFLTTCTYFLHSDSQRKTISKIENKIEKIKLDQEYLNTNLDKNKIFNEKLEAEIKIKQKEIENLKKSIEVLKNKIEKSNQK